MAHTKKIQRKKDRERKKVSLPARPGPALSLPPSLISSHLISSHASRVRRRDRSLLFCNQCWHGRGGVGSLPAMRARRRPPVVCRVTRGAPARLTKTRVVKGKQRETGGRAQTRTQPLAGRKEVRLDRSIERASDRPSSHATNDK